MSRLYLSPPDVGAVERALLLDAFDSNWVAPLGPHVDAFEAELAARVGVPYAAALSSGTAALHLALLILGVGPGDDVLVPSFTFAATAYAVAYVGARPVFVDSETCSWNMDPHLVAAELDRRAAAGQLPAAVIAVDLYGQCADYEQLGAACRSYDVPLIEDSAEALGATYHGQPAGGFGAIGVFSFNGNKIITCGGGGMLVAENEAHVVRARYLATQARDPAPHYQHSETGYNYRLSNLLAAVGRGQLRDLDAKVARRRAINRRYREHLEAIAGIDFLPVSPQGQPTHWLTCITIDPAQFGVDREDVRLRLEAADIESRPTWKPMHLQPVFAGCPAIGGALSARIFDRGLCLPSGSAMADADVDRVAAIVLDCIT
ncbi:MAG TPA: aminotransferase class I/II-fold pyridoxal phosphate-dependent enzyme [Acidimicrobiales bacterium]|jgi:dTDP-4-amino-4,6-dideoxygalactose transaminase|nr:aminotransferase class I/II-fold pyridoxal phosphate-dependent enzyme [Acidimicrobiales bacterium]